MSNILIDDTRKALRGILGIERDGEIPELASDLLGDLKILFRFKDVINTADGSDGVQAELDLLSEQLDSSETSFSTKWGRGVLSPLRRQALQFRAQGKEVALITALQETTKPVHPSRSDFTPPEIATPAEGRRAWPAA